MKRLLTILMLFLAVEANAQAIFWWSDGDFIGGLKTNFNQTMSNVVAAIAGGGVVTTNSHGGGIKIVGSTDSNTFYFLPYYTGSVGSISGLAPQSPLTNDLDAAGNSIENLDSIEITNTTTIIRLWGTNVISVQGTTNVALNGVSLKVDELNTPTNAFTPTALAVGAGDTCIVVRTGANLFSLVATSTPTTITFDSTWTTGHVGTCLIELTAGTNSIAFPTSVVHNVGRASSTNLTIGTSGVTELLFQKPIGSIWRVIQLTP